MTDMENQIIPRSYELEIVAVAKYRNTLACLPTLHGKNLITLLLIKHRLDRVKSIDSFLEISIAILVPTRYAITIVNLFRHCLQCYIFPI
jgi:ERCC4-related helicase